MIVNTETQVLVLRKATDFDERLICLSRQIEKAKKLTSELQLFVAQRAAGATNKEITKP
jgi:hypothetical protein